jgi:hypothetical protein
MEFKKIKMTFIHTKKLALFRRPFYKLYKENYIALKIKRAMTPPHSLEMRVPQETKGGQEEKKWN